MFLAACSGGDEETGNETPKDDEGNKEEVASDVPQEVRILDAGEIPTMDSSLAEGSTSFTALNQTNEGLYIQNENSELIDGVADGDPEANEDGTVFTVKIKDSAIWENDEPVTAHDFVYAFQRALKPELASPYGPYMMGGKIKGAQEIVDAAAAGQQIDLNTLGVKAIDDKTLEVQTAKPMSVEFFKGLMAFGTFLPLNQKFVEEKGDAYASNAENLLSNGPFKLTQWDGPTSQEWVFEKNEKYHGADEIALTRIQYNVVKDSQTAVNALETGEADITGLLSSDLVPQYESDPRMQKWLESTIFWIKMNQTGESEGNKALQNENIRRAIATGFDKEGLTASILNNGSVPANYAVPKDFVKGPDGKDFNEANGDMLTYNVEEAKKAWEAGLKELGTDKVTIRYLGGDTEASKKTDAYIKDQLEKNLPGLTIKLESVPFQVRLERDNSQDYDLQFAGWGPDYSDPISFSDLWVTDGGSNRMGYSNPEYDKLIKEAQSTSDQTKRFEALAKAEKILLDEDAGLAPVYQRGANILVAEKVKGFNYHQVGPDHSWRYLSITE